MNIAMAEGNAGAQLVEVTFDRFRGLLGVHTRVPARMVAEPLSQSFCPECIKPNRCLHVMLSKW